MHHYRPVNTYVARTLPKVAALRHAGGESSWNFSSINWVHRW
jgi:hypothetical protein